MTSSTYKNGGISCEYATIIPKNAIIRPNNDIITPQ